MSLFFTTADLGLTPKIRFSQVDGEIKVSWDQGDPELIALGFNDLTPAEWGQIIEPLEQEGVMETLLS